MPISVSHVELAGSGSHEFNAEGGSATRIFVCDYNQADRLCAELLGFPIRAGSEHQRRRRPQRHPSRPYLFCRTCRYEGYGAPGRDASGAITYTRAKVVAEYRPLDWDDAERHLPSGAYITERREFDRDFEPVPANDLRWQEGPDKGAAIGSDFDLLRRAPALVVRIDVHHWLNAPIDSGIFESMMGTVNDREFRPLWTPWPAESLLYEGAWFNRQFTADGSAAWRVSLQLRFKPGGWNRRVHRSLQRFDVATNTGRKIHPPVDFSVLLP
jgi:hypothetical protein